VIKLIVGLGNPGQQYEKTRHNAGFLFLDHLVSGASSVWSNEVKFHGLMATCVVGSGKLLALKPQTFMNKSGQSVGAVARYYKIEADEILVVHDELDLDAGVVRLKLGGGHAGHNGLRDIISDLGGKGFYRLRLGIGRPGSGQKVVDFVLSNSSKQEREGLEAVFSQVGGCLGELVSGNVAVVMNELNKKV